jgi:hypothetical protein
VPISGNNSSNLDVFEVDVYFAVFFIISSSKFQASSFQPLQTLALQALLLHYKFSNMFQGEVVRTHV